MPKRQVRKRRAGDEEEASDNEDASQLLDALADASVPLGSRDRKHGISVLDSDDAGQQEQHRGQIKDNKAAASDVLSQRMEEYVGSELDRTFQTTHQTQSDDGFTHNRIKANDEAVPLHLETKPVQEVSVPGFNKAITKVALTKDASGTVPTAVAMAKQKRSEPDKRDAVWVDRALFPSRFGKQRKT